MCEPRALLLIDSCGQIDRQNSMSPALLTLGASSSSIFKSFLVVVVLSIFRRVYRGRRENTFPTWPTVSSSNLRRFAGAGKHESSPHALEGCVTYLALTEFGQKIIVFGLPRPT